MLLSYFWEFQFKQLFNILILLIILSFHDKINHADTS